MFLLRLSLFHRLHVMFPWKRQVSVRRRKMLMRLRWRLLLFQRAANECSRLVETGHDPPDDSEEHSQQTTQSQTLQDVQHSDIVSMAALARRRHARRTPSRCHHHHHHRWFELARQPWAPKVWPWRALGLHRLSRHGSVSCHGKSPSQACFSPSSTDTMQLMTCSLAQSRQHSPRGEALEISEQSAALQAQEGPIQRMPSRALDVSHGQQDHASIFRWSSITA